MADIIKPKAPEVDEAPAQRIRITLTSTKVPALEKVSPSMLSFSDTLSESLTYTLV
jgi:hypothetical protein